MNMAEAAKKGIERIRRPVWPLGVYLRIHSLGKDEYEPWGQLFNRVSQHTFSEPTPQECWVQRKDASDYEAYEGPWDEADPDYEERDNPEKDRTQAHSQGLRALVLDDDSGSVCDKARNVLLCDLHEWMERCVKAWAEQAAALDKMSVGARPMSEVLAEIEEEEKAKADKPKPAPNREPKTTKVANDEEPRPIPIADTSDNEYQGAVAYRDLCLQRSAETKEFQRQLAKEDAEVLQLRGFYRDAADLFDSCMRDLRFEDADKTLEQDIVEFCKDHAAYMHSKRGVAMQIEAKPETISQEQFTKDRGLFVEPEDDSDSGTVRP